MFVSPAYLTVLHTPALAGAIVATLAQPSNIDFKLRIPVTCPLNRMTVRPDDTSDAFAEIRKVVRGNDIDGLI
jgi:hypothetical protein